MASAQIPRQAEVVYPDSDGQPMAENTLQFRWIVTIQGGLDALFKDDPDIFVAGDLLWYPVEGDNTTRAAPDAMVALGRPKGYRGSYRQWEEGGIAPQVVFEVRSPGNRPREMDDKRGFYEKFGVEEYYLYDPDKIRLDGWLRSGEALKAIPAMDGWVSPRLGIRFDLSGDELRILSPDGRPFATYVELAEQRDELAEQRDELAEQRDEAAEQRDEAARQRDEAARQRDEAARQRDEERRKVERLEARLRALGEEPD
jgi:Uma2 family endonuclease